jgi:FkbM family methyltransferase|tara:strand:- start:1106 stop:1807 length:702 start_codon:yes stop_codon:yes gene_type:complete
MKKNLLKNKIFYFFYKLLKIQRNRKPSYHFGEFAEDVFIGRLLKSINNGKYVDVGCYHPFKGSLTAKLYQKNWRGINIDVSKTSIDLFNIARKRDINLNCAISDFNEKTFYFQNGMINQQNSLQKSSDDQIKVDINCYTLNSVLENNDFHDFDYLNVDVEGTELNVIKGINFKKYKPKLITIENNELIPEEYFQSEIFKLLEQNNYVFVNKVGVTNFFLIKSLKNEISNLIKI